MKNNITYFRLALLLLILPTMVSCELTNVGPDEEEIPTSMSPYVVVDTMPELIGGLPALQRNVRYPEEARLAGIEGRVYVQCFVNELGYVDDAAVTRGLGYGLDEEALRVVKLARFYPARKDDYFVRVLMSLPVTFKIK